MGLAFFGGSRKWGNGERCNEKSTTTLATRSQILAGYHLEQA